MKKSSLIPLICWCLFLENVIKSTNQNIYPKVHTGQVTKLIIIPKLKIINLLNLNIKESKQMKQRTIFYHLFSTTTKKRMMTI